MIGTVMRVMVLGLLRDRGALALAFLLPPLFYIFFAAIFSGPGTGEQEPRIAVVDRVDDRHSRRLLEALAAEPRLRVMASPAQVTDATALVRSGDVDAALLLQHPLGRADEGGEPPLAVVADGSRALAAPMVAGLVQEVLAQALPDVLIGRAVVQLEGIVGGYTEAQQLRIAESMGRWGEQPVPSLVEQRLEDGSGTGAASYYAGAIALLFLLFASLHGAITLVDERRSGLLDRITLGPGGSHVILLGKALFLGLQGAVQITLIFLIAGLFYGVEWLARPGPWLLTTALAAFMAAGLGLLLASLSRTREQAQAVATFLVLLLAALGGSMVPRYLMPGWLQDLGWLSPVAWAIEAYEGVLWRGSSVAELWPAWAVLGGIGSAALLLALWWAAQPVRH